MALAVQPAPRRPDTEAERSIVATYPPPKVTARSWLVYDSGTGEPIAGQDVSTPRPIASLTKLMTALVVVERLDLDSDVTIPAAVNDLPADASRMDARAGERWKASDLLKATLVQSANDAALALALATGGGSEADFVELMNERAAKLGLSDTHFTSATGLDDTVASSTSTPVDLATLVIAAMAEEPIRDDLAIRTLELTRTNGQPLDPMRNRNPLLGTYDGVDGGKTGFTDAAGYMLVVHHTDDDTSGDLVVVTFASTSERTRVSDSRALLDWARPLRQNLVFIEAGTRVGSVPVQRSDEHVAVFACEEVEVSARVGQRLVQEVALPKSIAAPVRAGDEVGTIRVHPEATDPGSDEDAIDASVGASELTDVTVPLCAEKGVPQRSRRERLMDRARDWRSALRTGIDEVHGTWNDLT